jgi:hypothetical protein
VKAFVIFRDRVTYARRCVAALAAAGLDVHIVDHESTWPAAVSWLAECEAAGMPVLRRGGNAHPRDMWSWPPFRAAAGETEQYVVTDPDVVPADGCPPDWPDRLAAALEAHKVVKAALGLRTDTLPDWYPLRDVVRRWEAQFWQEEIAPGVYRAPADTTLALYAPLGQCPGFRLLDPAVRLGPPYLAEHLPWHEDPAALSDELQYYLEHAAPGSTYWAHPGENRLGSLQLWL